MNRWATFILSLRDDRGKSPPDTRLSSAAESSCQKRSDIPELAGVPRLRGFEPSGASAALPLSPSLFSTAPRSGRAPRAGIREMGQVYEEFERQVEEWRQRYPKDARRQTLLLL